VQRLCEAHTPDAVRALLEIATNQKYARDPVDGKFVPDPKAEETSYAPGPRVTAATRILEQGHGRPTQRVVHDGAQPGGGITVVIHQIGTGKIEEIDVTPDPVEIASGSPPS
jgi:hypothetical protein